MLFVALALTVALCCLEMVEVNGDTLRIGDGMASLTLRNISLGHNHDQLKRHQCTENGTFRFGEGDIRMHYTSNRRTLSSNDQGNEMDADRPQIAIIQTFAGNGCGSEMTTLDCGLQAWDSWREHLFYDSFSGASDDVPSTPPHHFSLILLIDHHLFLENKRYTTELGFVNNLLVNNMGAHRVSCAQLHSDSDGQQQPQQHRRLCGNDSQRRGGVMNKSDHWLSLDQGYWVYRLDGDDRTPSHSQNSTLNHTYPYPHGHNHSRSHIRTRMVLVFVSLHKFTPLAHVLAERLKAKETNNSIDEFDDRQDARDPTSTPMYFYVKYTNFYVYHALNLQILDYFQYFAKIDTDMFFRSRLTGNLVQMMGAGDNLLLTPYKLIEDGLRGVEHVLDSYVGEETAQCRNSTLRSASDAEGNPLHWKSGDATWQSVYSNFLVGSLAFYTSPEVRHLAHRYMVHSPQVMLTERWTDQQWWTHPLSMMTDRPLDHIVVSTAWTESKILDHKPILFFYHSKAGYWYTEGKSYSDSKLHREESLASLQATVLEVEVGRTALISLSDGRGAFNLLLVVLLLVVARRAISMRGSEMKAKGREKWAYPPPPPPPPPPPHPRINLE